MMEKPTSLFGFLNANDKVFRFAVLYLPLGTATLSLAVNLLIRGKGVKESLYEAAFMLLLFFFIGLVEEAFRYRRAH